MGTTIANGALRSTDVIRWHCLLVITVLVFLLPFCLSAQAPKVAELTPAEFKAATIYKMLPYVEWPEKDSRLVVAVLGDDPFSGLLSQILDGQRIKDRTVEVKILKDVSQIRSCQILFVSSNAMPDWVAWSQDHDMEGMLTVSDQEDFATTKGGMVHLSFKQRKLQINVKNARKKKVKINPKLLRIATVVKS